MRLNQRITGARQIRLVQEAISIQEEELESLLRSLKERKAKVATNANFISRLEVGIRNGRLHIQCLGSSIKGLEELRSSQEDDDSEIGLESDTESNLLYGSESLSTQISNKRKELEVIKAKVEASDEEIYAQHFIHDVALLHIENAGDAIERVKLTIQKLKSAFSPFWDIPFEVLASIFRIRAKDDFQDYLRHPGTKSSLSSAFILSHVCSFWRQIALNEPALWTHFSCNPVNLILNSHLELFGLFQSRGRGNVRLICNPAEDSGIGVNASQFGRAQELTDLAKYPNMVHLMIAGIDNELSVVRSMPFRGYGKLVLQLVGPASNTHINQILGLFTCKEITIVGSEVYAADLRVNLATIRSPLRLRFDVNDISSLNLGSMNLTDLHIIHSGPFVIPGNIAMSAFLTTLGITPPNMAFIHPRILPQLTHLFLYGPKDRTMPAVSFVYFSGSRFFSQIRVLELHNWPIYTPEKAAKWSVIPQILAIADKLRQVETIRIVDTFIDGERLILLVKSLVNPTSNPNGPKLSRIIITGCSGLTQQECESIAAEVKFFEYYL